MTYVTLSHMLLRHNTGTARNSRYIYEIELLNISKDYPVSSGLNNKYNRNKVVRT